MNERQSNSKQKKIKKITEYPLTNATLSVIMANMTNNNQQCFKRFQMSISDLCFACVFGVLSALSWVAIAWGHMGM